MGGNQLNIVQCIYHYIYIFGFLLRELNTKSIDTSITPVIEIYNGFGKADIEVEWF